MSSGFIDWLCGPTDVPDPEPRTPKAEENEVKSPADDDPNVTPDWRRSCKVCGERPILPLTGLCGPCTFGEAETAGGNW